ncbi:hypothetical protein [Grimontia sp. NTOU-MAR1]|uniref:hypothetical protein n=1 Tax=Grimontia sp. NTOU-MAR1 TaxID=3111011 RepID=UPI002DB617F3|nr:hypothetical protein [Grimontia sp. NTOU-MAR1]WRV99862.1 hypothetical protein VP504_23015 [Grimontia sp. NTOU-MAR1]
MSIQITDISELGMGFTSEWKLEEGIGQLKVNSLPKLRVEIRHKGEVRIGGRLRYRYGSALRRKLHSVQLSQIKRAA